MLSISKNKTDKLGNDSRAFAEALATVLLLQASAAKKPNGKDKNKAYVTRKSKSNKN